MRRTEFDLLFRCGGRKSEWPAPSKDDLGSVFPSPYEELFAEGPVPRPARSAPPCRRFPGLPFVEGRELFWIEVNRMLSPNAPEVVEQNACGADV